ncbi:serine/threonine protein kinase [bacterium]|nr:serine/threonine protein kinase [bacterium]
MEGRALAGIRHENVVAIYSAGQETQTKCPYLAMEWLEGKTLSAFNFATEEGKLRIGNVFRQICNGLHACHDVGIIHRDLKPANLFLNDNYDLKIFDFGIAKTSLEITESGQFIGTPAYVSPEQCMGIKDVTEKSDIYSIGIILWEMLFGEPPFKCAEGSNQVLSFIYQHIEAPLPEMVLDKKDPLYFYLKLAHKLLEKNPDDRPDINKIINILKTPDFFNKRSTGMNKIVAEPAAKPEAKSIGRALISQTNSESQFDTKATETGTKTKENGFIVSDLTYLCIMTFTFLYPLKLFFTGKLSFFSLRCLCLLIGVFFCLLIREETPNFKKHRSRIFPAYFLYIFIFSIILLKIHLGATALFSLINLVFAIYVFFFILIWKYGNVNAAFLSLLFFLMVCLFEEPILFFGHHL